MDLSAYILPEEDYKRLAELNYDYTGMSYQSFVNWNIQCINECTDEVRAWMSILCTRMGNNSIRIMDLEICTAYSASHLYFDHHKRLCIVNLC